MTEIRRPAYFDQFRCIAGVCEDTCCAGWEIEVDEESCSRYLQLEGKLGEEIRAHLTVTEEESYFPLKNGSCPFLNCQGLCRLIEEAGEDILCDICREHPRFYNWYGSRTEAGLGLSCPEAERLMFSDSRPTEFVTGEKQTEEEMGDERQNDRERAGELQADKEADTEEEEFVEQMAAARETAFAIVQNRTLPLGYRLVQLQEFGERLQTMLDTDNPALGICRPAAENMLETAGAGNGAEDAAGAAAETGYAAQNKEDGSEPDGRAAAAVRELLAEYRGLDAADAGWMDDLAYTAENAEDLLARAAAFRAAYPQSEWEYEHLAVYFVNRYFLEAVFDMDVLSKLRFTAAALLVIRLLEIGAWIKSGTRTEKERDRMIRRYSKEIEYCPEHVEQLIRQSWILDAFQTASMEQMIKTIFPA